MSKSPAATLRAELDPVKPASDGTFAKGHRASPKSYREWLRLLEKLPTDELATRVGQSSAERRALQTLVNLEVLSLPEIPDTDHRGEPVTRPNPFYSPEAAVKTNAVVARETGGPPGSDMIPTSDLQRWIRAVYRAAAELYGDDAPTKLNDLVKRKVTLTERKLLPKPGEMHKSESKDDL